MRLRAPRTVRRQAISSLVSLLVALALVWPLAESAHASRLWQDPLPCVEIVRHPLTGAPYTLRDCVTPVVPNASPETIARAFLRDLHRLFAMPASLADLRLLNTTYGLDSSHVYFQQTYQGLPVYGAYTSVHLDRFQRIQVLHNRYQADLAADLSGASVSASQAVQIAQQAIGLVRPRSGNAPPPEQVIFPQADHSSRLAWKVIILAAEPQGDWEVLVDATNGSVIKRYNRLVQARGQVFNPNPRQQSGRTGRDNPNWPELQTVTLQGLDGSGWLRGQYVDVASLQGYVAASAFQPNGNFVYGPDDPRFEEVMVYYHVDSAQRYIQSLGYSASNTPANGIRDRVTQASAHWFAQDQSFYSSSDDALHFGDGGMEDAEDADIIVHEYGHALQYDQLPYWGEGEMEALGEGFGDYLAASRFAGVGSDPACIAEWDSISYAPGPPYCLRRVDRDRHYPDDMTGDPHIDGEIWSRALWDLRAALGARIADTLALESHFYLPSAASLADAARALFDADANVYDNAHLATMGEILVARGLLTLPSPTVNSPNGGETISRGSLVGISWEANHNFPAAYEVQYSVDADAAIDRLDSFSSSRLPGDYITYGNLPWRIESGAARAGAVGHHQSSSLFLPINLARTSSFSFAYRVSSEARWDFLEFFLDGQQVLQISGETGWARYSRTLQAGPHKLLWRYRKDSTVSSGQDLALIDDVDIGNVSLANWHDVDLVPNNPTGANVTWRIPNVSSAAVKIRVRARLNGVASQWDTSDRTFVIGEPAAVRLTGLAAAATARSGGGLPVALHWALVLVSSAGVGLALSHWERRRRRL